MQRIIFCNTCNTVEEAVQILKQDSEFIPIECCFGNVSIVNYLELDHHGEFSHLEPVSIRGYRDYYGIGSKFLVTGFPDCDATFAIASIAGIIEKDKWIKLAELIARVDSDPIGIDLLNEGLEGELIMLFNQLKLSQLDSNSWLYSVLLWKKLLSNVDYIKHFILTCKLNEIERRRKAWDCEHLMIGDVLAINKSPIWAFDIWYSKANCVVALTLNDNITIGCPNLTIAEKLFGKGGLKNVFEKLTPQGWGGRETVGGSPRGLAMDWNKTIEIANTLNSLIVR